MARKAKEQVLEREDERFEERFSGVPVNRFEEEREYEDRDSIMRAISNAKFADPLYFPPELVPHGWEYRWVRHSLLGIPDDNNMFSSEKKGWRPVPASRHQEMLPKDYLGTRGEKQKFFIVADAILCERPVEYGDAEREAQDKHNHEVLISMPGLNNLMGESTMPVRNSTETYTSRAVRHNR